MNGGMDFLCGRLVYYDEVSQDFSSPAGDRVEYLKSAPLSSHFPVDCLPNPNPKP